MNYARLVNNKRFYEALAYAEREVYTKAYAFANGNQSRVASLIGVSRGTAIYKLKSYELI